MKKLGSVLVVLALFLSVCPMAMAADDFTPEREGNGVHWSGGTVTLTGDVTMKDRVFVWGDTTLDLNGYNINCVTDDNPFLIWGGATLTVTGEGTINCDNPSSLFFVNNYRKEFTPAQFDEEGNLIQEEIEQDITDVGRLVLESGTFNALTGGVAYISGGAEAQIGNVTLNGGIYNNGAIGSIAGAKLTGNEWAIHNLGEIDTIKDCTIQGAIFVGQMGKIGLITDSTIESSNFNKLVSDGEIGTVRNTVFMGVSMGISTGARSSIDFIENVEMEGVSSGIGNHGSIGTIKNSRFKAVYHGMENMGLIDAIIDCEFGAEKYTSIQNHPANSNLDTHDNPEGYIGLISGGNFVKKFFNSGVVEKITGGAKFDGIDNARTIHLLEDYTIDYAEYGEEAVGLWNSAKGVIDTLGKGTFIGTGAPIQNDGAIGAAFDGAVITGTGTIGGLPQEQPKPEEPQAVAFSDMESHWAKVNVADLAQAGIINGYPDGSFGPANPVTRGEIAKLVVATKGMNTKGGEPLFADTKGTWSEKYVNALSDVLQQEAYPDGFHQEAQATRMEVVTILMRAMGYDAAKAQAAEAGRKTTFTDMEGLTADQVYYVDAAVSSGIIKGASGGKLNPDEPISRAEVATMLDRVLEARK